MHYYTHLIKQLLFFFYLFDYHMCFKIVINNVCALEFFVYFHFFFPLYSLNPPLLPYLQSDAIRYV